MRFSSVLSGGLIVLSAAAYGAPRAEIIKYQVYRPETVEAYQAVRLQNGKNNYVLKFVEQKPENKTPSSFQIRLREPSIYYSFSRPVNDFLRIKVNGISLNDLSPDLSLLKTWSKDDRAGVNLPLNFGGVPLELSFYLQGDNPLLHCTISNPSGRAKEVEVALNAVISELDAAHLSGVYDRAADTNRRTLGMDLKTQKLNADENSLLLYDMKRQPGMSKNKNCAGPCFAAWRNNGLAHAEITLQNSYHTQIRFYLAPGFRDFAFSLFESSRPRTNAEFKSYLAPFR